MSSTRRGSTRAASDNYPTPSWALHRFLDVFVPMFPDVLSSGRWLEPGAGEGNLIHAAKEWFQGCSEEEPVWDACEVRPECLPFLMELGVKSVSIGDYFQLGPPTHEAYDLIITNPPFSLAMEFIRRSLRARTRYVAMLQRLNFIGTAARHEFMSEYPPDLYILPNRPSFKATGETDSIEYAWYVWDTQHLGKEGEYVLLDLTPHAERKAEHDRILNAGIFPVLGTEE